MNNLIDDGSFGERLTGLIKKCGTSNRKVADKLGVSATSVGVWIKTHQIEYENLRKLADLFDVNWVWLRYGPMVLDACQKDIADGDHYQRRKRLELMQELVRLEEKNLALLELLDNLPLVLFKIDVNGIFTMSEGAGLKDLGLIRNQVVGMSVFDVYTDNPYITDGMRKGLRGYSDSFMTEEAGIKWNCAYKPVYGEEGQIVGVIGVAMKCPKNQQTNDLQSESQ